MAVGPGRCHAPSPTSQPNLRELGLWTVWGWPSYNLEGRGC